MMCGKPQPGPAAAGDGRPPRPCPATGTDPSRAAGHPRPAAQRPVRRRLAGRDVGHAAGGGRLPRIDPKFLPAGAPGPGKAANGDGPANWTYYSFYMILDIYSRYVTGWMVADRESAALARVLIHQACARQGIGRDQLTIHADRGPSMTSRLVAFLLADLGVAVQGL